MRQPIFIVFMLITYLPAFSQVALHRQESIEQICHAKEIASGPEREQLHQIITRIRPVVNRVKGHHIQTHLVDSKVINAWHVHVTQSESVICIPIAMSHFEGDAEAELAFTIAHEVGHALDNTCKSSTGRSKLIQPHLDGLLRELLGKDSRDVYAEQRACESRADELGFAIIVAAGYNPYAAAGSFGRWEMFRGDISTDAAARANEQTSMHPITPDRIRNLRKLLRDMKK